MKVTPGLVVVAVVFLVLGWVMHLVWDWIVDWIYDSTGWVSSVLWDLFAILGVLVVVCGIGFGAVHYHWMGAGT